MDSSTFLRQRRNQEERLVFDDDEPAKKRLIRGPPKSITLLLAIPTFVFSLMLLYVACNSTFETKSFKLPPPPELTGVLAENTLLQKPVKLLDGKIIGPESILIEGDTMYTGTADGRVLKIVKSSIVGAKRLGAGKSCGHMESEFHCGRPLGIRRLDADRIIVLDAYHGLFTIDFDHDEIVHVLDTYKVNYFGRRLMFLNDLDVYDTDTVFFTESSSKWRRNQFNYIMMENLPNGRVFKYTISSSSLQVVIEDLHYPNGITILPDKLSLLVCETNMARVVKYTFAGESNGMRSVWAVNLPGLPNNIRPGSGGTFWIGFMQARHRGDLSLVDALSSSPFTRKAMLSLIPNQFWHDYAKSFTSKHTIVVQTDPWGMVIRSLQDPDGHDLVDVSEINETDEYLYFGSLTSTFIARVHKHLYEHHFDTHGDF